MTTRTKGLLLAGALLLAACGGEPDEDAGAGTEGAQDTTGMPGMNMPGTQAMPGMQMMNDMMAHMQQMEGLSMDSMRAMMPRHRQMADSALAEMERQMQGMNMSSDAQWNALADSLRQDMGRMSEMSAAEVQAAMPAHHARMQRLMEMHRAMMPPAPE